QPAAIEWFPPDEQGRPTGARVFLRGRDCPNLPYEGFTVYPPWWPELPPSPQPWVRQHLVGWHLGGPGRGGLRNLIPGSWWAADTLRSPEGLAFVQSHQNGQHLVYEIVLTYDAPQNRYPSLITVRAYPIPGSGSTWFMTSLPIRNYPPA